MNEEKLKTTFIDALGIPRTTDVSTLEYRSIPEWDSVAHMQLVAAIESAFDIMLDTDDVIGMSSFAMARRIVAKHGVAM